MTTNSDRYTHGHHASVVGQHARRTAEVEAAFLLPHLSPGMRLLDVGCGPGTITTGLARVVAPGEVVGIDVVPAVLEQAREANEGTPNVRFEEGSVYALGFPDASFDVCYAHQVLQHLTKPVDAAREMRRVLRPGGLAAVRDADYATMTALPHTPEIDRWLALYHAVATRNEAEADAGRHLPGWLVDAGFQDVTVSATTVLFHERAAVENWGLSWAERVTHSALATQAIEYGMATQGDLETIADGWRRWAREPQAFFFYVNVEAIGRA
ncbi:MAG: methyltransferase domain-containing protein [Chloroflexi bacterium]|nr:MAG: methyltransferase domain-containing protein [Chloroflexota bacterium]